MKLSACKVLILGLWLGSTAVMGMAVSYSFWSIDAAPSVDQPPGDRATRDGEEPTALRSRTIIASVVEYKQTLIRDWNRVQLVLAAVALIFALSRNPTKGVVLPLMLAACIVLALTFYMAPRIADLSRELDFASRQLEAVKFEEFDLLHDAYKLLEGGKIVFLLLASFFAMRDHGPGPSERPT